MTIATDDHRRGRRERRLPACPSRRRVRPGRDLPLLAQLVAEVLAGQRSPRQLRPCLSESAYRSLLLRAGCYTMRQRPRLRMVVLDGPEPGVAEVSGVVAYGERHRALALRVVYAEYRWVCTHIETDVR
ncbi:Rv3235 family protein [Thermobifida cellulosilytica]|uniref:Rv3235 family protein n=1 Tax=Thermobifida cellulosilytica TaxID=144786 RepID=UPI000AEB4CD4|nr:Rv3235 family protein [Thermobifida cellulosilytica]